jgi:hypothetical protein
MCLILRLRLDLDVETYAFVFLYISVSTGVWRLISPNASHTSRSCQTVGV